MKTSPRTRGEARRVMYVENKDGDINGAQALRAFGAEGQA
jgi:hypothetical protein